MPITALRPKLAFLCIAGLALLPATGSRFYLYIASIVLVTGLLATSLNLVLGYGGIYQFHHGVFYGTGAYAFALAITKGGFSAWVAFLLAPLVAGLLGLVMGAICIRLSKLYFGMLQISLGSLVWAVSFRWYDFTGGDNGIHGVPLPDLISSSSGVYYFTLVIVALSSWVLFRIVNSPFGKLSQAVRDNPVRGEGIGLNVRMHQLLGLVIAAVFAGLAGSLFVLVEGSVVPDLLFWNLSLEIVVMCLVGGWFTFFGPMIGAAVIVCLRTVAGMYTEYWTSILGLVLVLTIFFLPEGVCGALAQWTGSKRAIHLGNSPETQPLTVAES